MRQPLSWVTVLALSTLGCHGGFDANPTAPSSPTNRYTVAAVGDVVRAQVTSDDVPCDFGFYCKYFQVAVSRDGTFEVGLTHARGRIHSAPIDMWIMGAGGSPTWMDGYDPDVESYARMRAVAGTTYEVGVVSYEMPSVSFQLRFSLVP